MGMGYKLDNSMVANLKIKRNMGAFVTNYKIPIEKEYKLRIRN